MTERHDRGDRSEGTPGGAGAAPSGVEPSPVSVAEADELLRWAARARSGRDHQQRRLLLDVLAERSHDPDATSNVDEALAAVADEALAGLWEDGWQPHDLVRLAGRGAWHASLVVDWIARQAAGQALPLAPVEWRAQLEDLGARTWWGEAPHLRAWAGREGVSWRQAVEAAVEALARLLVLPSQPHLLPPPSRWAETAGRRPERPAGLDAKVIAKVRGLLAKAESTDFTAEAEALSAKAQELITRHAIDRALLGAGSPGADEVPGGRRIPVEDPYASGKSLLLQGIARANRSKAVWSKGLGFCTVFGFPGDLDAVELLHTSLLVQATAAMAAAGSHVDADGTTRTRSFRSSFLTAFALRIGDRLQGATGAHVAAAAEGDARLLPVLAARDDAVQVAVAAAFPRLVPHRPQARNRAGWVAGQVAADAAELDVGPRLGARHPRLTA